MFVDGMVNGVVGTEMIEVADMVMLRAVDTATVVDSDMANLDLDSLTNCNRSPEIEVACIDRNRKVFCSYC
jgi:hypothetical protein